MGEIVIPYKPRESQERIHDMLDQHRFGVVVAHRRMGKTVAMVNHLIRRALTDGKERGSYGYVAPFRNQAKLIAWDYLKRYTAVLPHRAVNEQDLFIELPGRARIRIFGADNPDSLRGMYFDGVVLDEVAQMKTEVWGEIIRPALADRRGWAVFIGTPQGINLFSDMYQRAVDDASGQWAALTFPVTETLKTADPPLTAEEVEEARQDMGENAYRQEFLCDFTADEPTAFISFQAVHDAAGRERPHFNPAPLVIGVDLAAQGNDRSCLVVRRGPVLESIDIWREPDTMKTVGLVGDAIDRLKPQVSFVDSAGLGIGPTDRLKQLGYRVIGINSGVAARRDDRFANLKAEMWWKMAEWLETAVIPNDNALRKDLLAPRMEYDGKNRVKVESKDSLRKRLNFSTDIADALALTFAQPVADKDRAAGRQKYAEMD